MASIAVAIRYASNLAEFSNNLKQGTNQIEVLNTTAEKLAERLGGAKMIQAAHNLVGAIDKVGASTLTAGQASSSLAQLERAMEKLHATGKPIPAAMQATADALKKVVDQAGGLEAAAKRMTTAGTAATSTGQAMMPLSLAVAGVGIASVKMATDFNESMANVASLIPGGTARIVELKTEVQSMAIETGKSTGDLANGLYQVVSAFGDTADTASILRTNARAAAAGLAETTDAINLTSAVTKAYGEVNADTVAHVSDLALLTVRLGQTTFPELAASVGRVTPLAAELKVTQEELFGVMATFTGVTGGAAEVSTQLRGVLQSLMAPTESMTSLMGGLGYESGQAMVQGLGLQGTIDAIVGAAKASGTPLQKYMGSIEGQTLALAAAGGQSVAFTEKLEAMKNAAGTTDVAFREQTEGINAAGFAWKQFKSELQVLSQRIGDALLPRLMQTAEALRPVWDAAKAAASWFGQLPEPVQTTVIAFAGLIVVASPLLIWIGKIATAIGALMSFFAAGSTAAGVLSGAFALLTGPIGLAVAAVVGLIAVWKIWGDDITRIVSEAYTAVKTWLWDKLEPVLTPIIGLVSDVADMFSVFGSLVGAVARLAVEYIAKMASEVIGWLSNKLAPVFQFIGTVARGVADAFSWLWSQATLYARLLYEGVKAFLLDHFTAMVDSIRAQIQKVTGFFKGLYESIVGKTPEVQTAMIDQALAMDATTTSAADLAAKLKASGAAAGAAAAGTRQASPEMKKFADDVNDLKTKIANLTAAGVPASEIVKRLGADAIKTAEQAQEMGVRVDKLPLSIRLLKADAEALAKLLEEAKPFKKFADDAQELETRLRALKSAGAPAAEIVALLGKDALKSAEEARQLGLGVGSVSPAIIAIGRDYVILTALQKTNDDVAKLTPKIVGDNVKATAEWVAARRKAEDDLLAKARATSSAVIALGYTEVEKKVAAAGQWRDESLRAIEVLRIKEPEMHRAISEMIAKEYLKRTDDATSSIARIAEKIENIGATVANVGGQIASEMGGRWGDAVGHASAAFGAGAKSISSFMKGEILAGIQAGVAAVISFGKTISAVFGNETKGARDEFAKGMNLTLDQLMAKLQASGAKGQELANQALNVIGRHDVAANQAWMKEVSAFFEKTTADIQRTADVLAKYGAVWEQLPAALQAKSIADEVKTLAEEHVILTANGYSTAAATTAQADAYNELLAKALKAGAEIPPAMLPALLRMAELGQMTEANMRAMLGLKDESLPDFKAMEEAAKKYGIELGDLGPKFQQAKLNDLFKGLLSDFTLLREGGANMAVVIEKMGPQVNDAVQQAIKFGTEIPASMRPMIEAMASAGQLVGENGEKLTDLGALKWATPIEESMKELVKLFKELITQMMGAKTAVQDIPPRIDVEVGWRVHPFPDMSGAAGAAGAAASAHSGALVTAGRIQRFHDGVARVLPFPRMASDEVPAILQTGEAVLRREAVSALGVDAVSALNDMGGRTAGAPGSRGGNVVDLAAVTGELKALRAEQARRDAGFAQTLARAVRDEMQKVVNR